MSNQSIAIYAAALKRQKQEAGQPPSEESASRAAQAPAQTPTQARAFSRDTSRASARKPSRKKSRDLPTRDEIQEFSFRMRDELKVKVQAEVPHHWHTDLEEIARDLKVKKLELYRFIIGEFLGKVQRKRDT